MKRIGRVIKMGVERQTIGGKVGEERRKDGMLKSPSMIFRSTERLNLTTSQIVVVLTTPINNC